MHLMTFTAGVRTPFSCPEGHLRLAERMLARRWCAREGLQEQSFSPGWGRGFCGSSSTHSAWVAPSVTQGWGPGKARRAVNRMLTERVSEPCPSQRGRVPCACPSCPVLGHHPFLRATESLSCHMRQYRAWLTGLAKLWKEEKLVKCLLTKEYLKRKG